MQFGIQDSPSVCLHWMSYQLCGDVCLYVCPETLTFKLRCHVIFRCEGSLLLWNGHPLKCSGFPVDLPVPFSPVQSARKFSAVLGVISANSSKTIRPAMDRKFKDNNVTVLVTNSDELNHQHENNLTTYFQYNTNHDGYIITGSCYF